MSPAEAKPSLALLGLLVAITLTACGGVSTSNSSSTSTKGGPPTSISLTPRTAALAVGVTQQLLATGNYGNGTTQDLTTQVAWSSSDTKVVTVQTGQTNPGVITAVASGSATITATLQGVNGTSAITVNAVTPTSISLTPNTATIVVGVTQQLQASAKFNNGTVQDVTSQASWSSSDAAAATVQTGQTSPGLVTGVSAGTATITATFSGINGTAAVTVTSPVTGKVPLMDMTETETYQGFQGGLYENVSNQVPTDHDAAGKTFAGEIQPLDTSGNPSASGKIVFTSIGMSNAADEFGVFVETATSNASVNHSTLTILNGALGGITACMWFPATGAPSCSPQVGNQYDRIRDTILTPAGFSEAQVQVVWIKEANGGPGVTGCGSNGVSPCAPLCDQTTAGCSNTPTNTDAMRYEQELGEILRAAKARWPNLKLAFLSTRIYGGYATDTLSPEPYAYEYGFSAKWSIEAQINQIRTGTVDSVAGDLNYSAGTAPWVAWSAYIWADGPNPRSDGLVWCDGQVSSPCNSEVDFQSDGTHPSSEGEHKVANMLMSFFSSSPYTTGWFLAK